MYQILRKKNETLKEEVVDFARRLVQAPSPSLQEDEVADIVESKMNELDYDEVRRDEAGNVIGVMYGHSGGRTLLLNAHMDTVEADENEWDSDPFEARVEDGRLIGLGASDCKGGLAVCVYAPELLRRSLLPLKGNLVVAATVAEENGRSVGVHQLLDETLPEMELEPDQAVLGEPTELDLYYGHDGWLELKVRIDGEDRFQVDDAAGAVYRDLHSDYSVGADNREHLYLHGPQVAEKDGRHRATIRMDRRLGDSEDPAEVARRVRHTAARAAQATGAVAVEVDVAEEDQRLYTGRTITVRNVTHAWSTDPFDPLVERSREALSAAGCDAKPGKWHLDRLRMGTAGGVMVEEYDLPAVGYGPGSEQQAHAPNESVEISRLTDGVYGMAALSHALVGLPVFGWTANEI